MAESMRMDTNRLAKSFFDRFIARLLILTVATYGTPAPIISQTAQASTVSCINDLTVRSKPGKIQLVWTNIPDTARYDILRSDTPDGAYTKIADTTSTYSTYLDTAIVNDTLYYYQVGRISADGSASCISNTIAAIAPPRANAHGVCA